MSSVLSILRERFFGKRCKAENRGKKTPDRGVAVGGNPYVFLTKPKTKKHPFSGAFFAFWS
jgi:hypothetical protein